jgi:hypothetical protein
VVVGHEIWTLPLLAVDVDARASKVAVLRVFENGDPGRRLGVLEPLRAVVLAYRAFSGWREFRGVGCGARGAVAG